MRTEIKEIKMENLYLSNLITCRNINTVEPFGTDTSLLRTVSNVSTKFSFIFFKKKRP